MRYFDYFTDRLFRRDSQSQWLFFPWGFLGKGYILPDESRKRHIHGLVKRWNIVSILLITLTVVGTIPFSAGTGALMLSGLGLILLLSYNIATARQVRGYPVSDRRLSLTECLIDTPRPQKIIFTHILGPFIVLIFLPVIVVLGAVAGILIHMAQPKKTIKK